MTKSAALLAMGAMALAPSAGNAAPTTTPPTSLSISPPVVPNQPNQSCEDLGTNNQPGNAGSSSNTGSAFSPNGQAGGKYAGEQDTINNKNTVSVSQYDVACLHNQSNK